MNSQFIHVFLLQLNHKSNRNSFPIVSGTNAPSIHTSCIRTHGPYTISEAAVGESGLFLRQLKEIFLCQNDSSVHGSTYENLGTFGFLAGLKPNSSPCTGVLR